MAVWPEVCKLVAGVDCSMVVWYLSGGFARHPLQAIHCNLADIDAAIPNNKWISCDNTCCCPPPPAEPVEVIEPTVIAALNMNYPGQRLKVHVLDDGNKAAVKDMVKRLQYQCR